MEILDQRTTQELHKTLLAEIAKATNELRCARGDLDKATSRLSFLIMLTNKLIERQGD